MQTRLEKKVLKEFGEKSKKAKEFYKILERKGEELERVSIVIEYSKSGNAHAKVAVFTSSNCEVFEGKATNWGIDLESCAVAQAFNKSAALLASLYEKENKRLGKHQKVSRREYCGEASGSDTIVLPYFKGGAGIWSLIDVCKKLGLKKCYATGGENSKSYIITK